MSTSCVPWTTLAALSMGPPLSIMRDYDFHFIQGGGEPKVQKVWGPTEKSWQMTELVLESVPPNLGATGHTWLSSTWNVATPNQGVL